MNGVYQTVFYAKTYDLNYNNAVQQYTTFSNKKEQFNSQTPHRFKKSEGNSEWGYAGSRIYNLPPQILKDITNVYSFNNNLITYRMTKPNKPVQEFLHRPRGP